MYRFVPVPAIIFPGLIASAILGFLQIHRCMDPILKNALLLQEKGILTLPHGPAIESLSGADASLYAALLFVFSLGAGLTMASFALAFASRNLVSDHRYILFPSLWLWAGLLFFVNQHGPVLFPSLWVLIIPAITWKSTLKHMPESSIREPFFHKTMHLVPLIILTLAAMPMLSKGMFLDIRDSLLFSTRAGLAISDAYYRHTLPAAEVIKPIAARQLKLYQTDLVFSEEIIDSLKGQGWHPASPGTRPHIRIGEQKNFLTVSGSEITKTRLFWPDFESAPGHSLDKATLSGDRLKGFRGLILYCLIPGFPLLLYIFLFSTLRRILAWIFDRPAASLLASGICLTAGLLMLVPIHYLGKTERGPQNTETLNSYLVSEKKSQRLHAMRSAAKGKNLIISKDILDAYLSHGSPAERYWTTAYLGARPSETNWPFLLQALKDPQINVVCKAVEALSLAGPVLNRNKEAQQAILETLQTSSHPYIQWYAFMALKRLGPLPDKIKAGKVPLSFGHALKDYRA
ncbi:HEAT repeat domain-containing protein [Desulfobotulus mexicanus]|uniref:HEAT repeat domain-containing protein n=1 Tax=Desulfobotulus mexicanus TaxID=2586642 RepID=A0A5Q4VG24_9BACT|nr:HEAT repeat domain-containing protein [Desulfobotulus mexicanus]TYT75090.1 HEAT repeat domain-containing protein [Desulfobotulus mexicanus]